MRNHRCRSITLVIAIATVVAGCSSSKTVRSDSGPSTASQNSVQASTTTNAPTTSTTLKPIVPSIPASLHFSAPVALPAGPPGKLSVIASGALSGSVGSSVPVVVRNNTRATVSDVQVSATARSGGALVGSGSSQTVEPNVVKPGEFALEYVYFQNTIPPGSTFDFTATAQSGETSNNVDLRISEVNERPGQFGGQSVIGIVANDTNAEVKGPISVLVACFQGSTLLSIDTGFTDADSVAAKGTASFSVDVPEGPCPIFAVGSSGFSF